MEVRFRCNTADYLEAFSEHYKKSPVFYVIYFGIIACVFAVTGILTRGFPYGLFLVFSSAWLFSRFVFRPVYLKRDFRRHPNLAREYLLRIDEEGICFKCDVSQEEKSWSAFTKWGETRNVFLVYLGARLFDIIPKRAFSDPELNEFRKLLSRHLPGK